jgi:hypothetical protein
MKTIKLTVTAALLAIVTITTAVERPQVNVTPVSLERALITIVNETAAIFEVSIHAQNGDLVYYKQTSEPLTGYNRMYDFKNLAEGKYILSLKVNDTNVSNEFEVSRKGIAVGEKKITFDPYFNFNNNELKLSYLNFDQKNLNLYLYNERGLIYESKLGKEFSITKGYDLSKLESGIYRVVLSSSGKQYSYNIVK